MAKKMLIDATHAEETRVVVVDGNKVEEFDFESENKRQLAGNIYLARVTRVEPSLQAAFVDYGGNRHGFLAFSEIHPDYYQIPVADRQALMEEERAYVEAQKARDEADEKPKPKRRSRSRAAAAKDKDPKATQEIDGMETIDLDADADVEAEVPADEAASPMETVAETPVETPASDETAEEATADTDAPEDDQPAAETVGDDDQAVAEADGDDDEDDTPKGSNAAAKDDSIESVADEDDQEDIRPARKPRPKRYKIQEVVKVRQILLVQVVKEERGNKGAALTTYLSLAGRYCVLMPNTARGGGISRKITNAADRKKLKEIANEIDVPQGAGLIVRTAGSQRTKAEIKRDYEYLQRLWEQIRELTLKSIAPAKIYEEGDLIKRSIRDLYNRDIDEVFVEGERGYRTAKDFMKMIMPSHAKNVKLYTESLPLFARYQVETYLGGMFNPTVQLKSGGYIVIGITEALVAIDVNSGRSTKEGSIEDTALKTNLEAAEEVARQLRLRDLAGLIVIDFIDMDERKNNTAVEKRMKDKLKTDRARIQVGRISGFGLMEMSRQRLRPGMIEATTQPCSACHGTGLIRSDDNLALSILRQIEEEGTRRRSREVLVKCPVGIANFLMNQKREHIAQIEGRYGLSVRIEGEPHLISPDFSIEKFKTATRVVKAVETAVVSVDTSLMDQVDEDDSEVIEDEAPAATGPAPASETTQDDGEQKSKRRRRRRRRGRGKGTGQDNAASDENASSEDTPSVETTEDAVSSETVPEEATEEDAPAPKKKPTRTRRSKSGEKAKDKATSAEPVAESTTPEAVDAASETVDAASEGETTAAEPEAKPAPKPRRSRAKAPKPAPETEVVVQEAPAQEAVPEPAPAPVAVPPAEPEPVAAETVVDDAPPKPKKRGWWSLGK
ncbi:ribonuclease E/G [Tateyamaria sp. Alg231-49]|uniref:Rne/Rng family ribonuclease n=1 Tax=Tateyamaria sp. Alg231-49 TaxID=1922219 RepID=UPI000D5599FF|nr:ribonuclease E/G [Tateyamaria sp. Alg231-49]